MSAEEFKAGQIVRYTNPVDANEARARFVVTEDSWPDRGYVYIRAINSTLPSPLPIVPIECVGKEHIEKSTIE